MSDHTNCEKLADILNRTSQQGKEGFVRMLWSNQSPDVQSRLMPLLGAEALAALEVKAAS